MASNPTIFSSRFSDEYRQDLLKRFDAIREEAVDAPSGPVTNSGRYTRRIEIIYVGVSASILLDIDGDYQTENAIAKRFKKLVEDVRSLNEEGFYLHVKILLAYPFSEFARQLMIAGGRRRVTLQDMDRETQSLTFEELAEFAPDYERNPTEFRYYQQRSIRVLDALYVDKLMLPNSFDVRFTPLPLNYSGLFINKAAYYDLYCYAKMSREDAKLASRLPILKVVDQGDAIPVNRVDDDNFKCLLNDFDYLWTHPTTMFYKDATIIKRGERIVRKPADVQHRSKLEYMRERHALKKNASTRANADELYGLWEFAVEQLINQSTTEVRELLAKETIFIACSWRTAGDPHGQPNPYALELQEFISTAFRTANQGNALEIILVNVDQGARLSSDIFRNLNTCSHGIVILSKDIREQHADGKMSYYPRPNISHEMGYLGHRLGGYGSKKICVIEEIGVKGPSNVADISKTPFDHDKFCLVYGYVLDWISKEFRSLSIAQLEKATKRAKGKLKEFCETGRITQEEHQSAVRTIDKVLRNYRARRS